MCHFRPRFLLSAFSAKHPSALNDISVVTAAAGNAGFKSPVGDRGVNPLGRPAQYTAQPIATQLQAERLEQHPQAVNDTVGRAGSEPHPLDLKRVAVVALCTREEGARTVAIRVAHKPQKEA